MDMKFLLLMINAAAFCHGLGGNDTDVPKATPMKPVVVNIEYDNDNGINSLVLTMMMMMYHLKQMV